MLEVGKFYLLSNDEVGECVQILEDVGLMHPVTLFFEDQRIYRSYTLDGHYLEKSQKHILDVVGEAVRSIDLEAVGKRTAEQNDSIC